MTRDGGQWVVEGARLRCVVPDIAAELRRYGLDVATEASASPSTVAVVCDASSSDDLAAIVKRYWLTGVRTLWCGTRGLARALADHSAGTGSATDTAAHEPPALRGPVLVVVGTDHPVSVAQAGVLERQPGVACHTVEAGTRSAGVASSARPRGRAGRVVALRHPGRLDARGGAAHDRAGAARRGATSAPAGNGRGDGRRNGPCAERSARRDAPRRARRVRARHPDRDLARRSLGRNADPVEVRRIRCAGSVRPGGRVGHRWLAASRGTPDDPSCRDRGRSRGDWPGNHSQGRAEVRGTARSRARGRRSAREHRCRGEAARRRLLDALAGGQRLVRLRARGHSAARRGHQDRRGVRGGGRGRVCGHRARGRTGDVRARERHRDGADQQGGAEPRRTPVLGSHRIARAPIRRRRAP